MRRYFILVLVLFSSSASFGQKGDAVKRIDSLINLKTHTGADIPAIRMSAGYPTGENGMTFYPDSVSNQLSEVSIYRPEKIDNVNRLTFYYHHNELIKIVIATQNLKETIAFYFIDGDIINTDTKLPENLSKQFLLSKAKENLDYYYAAIK